MNDTANAVQWMVNFYSAMAVIQFTVLAYISNRLMKANSFLKMRFFLPLLLSFITNVILMIGSATILREVYKVSMHPELTYLADPIKCWSNINYYIFIAATIFTLVTVAIVIFCNGLGQGVKLKSKIAGSLIIFLLLTSSSSYARDSEPMLINFVGDVPADVASAEEYAGLEAKVGLAVKPRYVNIRFTRDGHGKLIIESYNRKIKKWIGVGHMYDPGPRRLSSISYGLGASIKRGVEARDCDPVQVIVNLSQCTPGAGVDLSGRYIDNIDPNGRLYKKDVIACRGEREFKVYIWCDVYSETIMVSSNPERIKREGIVLKCD